MTRQKWCIVHKPFLSESNRLLRAQKTYEFSIQEYPENAMSYYKCELSVSESCYFLKNSSNIFCARMHQ